MVTTMIGDAGTLSSLAFGERRQNSASFRSCREQGSL